jgi:hypothetical protein
LSKDQAKQLADYGLRMYDYMLKQNESKKEPEKEAKPEAQAKDPRDERLERLEAQLGEMQSKSALRDIDEAIKKDKVLAPIADGEGHALIQSQVMLKRYQQPSLSVEAAAKKVSKEFDALLRKGQSEYVKSKVAQADQEVKGKGAAVAPTPPKWGRKEFLDGTVAKSAIARLMRSQQASS